MNSLFIGKEGVWLVNEISSILIEMGGEGGVVHVPETVGLRVHVDVGDGAGVLGRVDEAKVVRAGCSLLQVGGEEGLVEAGFGVVEEGVLRTGLNW